MVGVALYGRRRWKRPLARDLRVDVRTLFRWLKGEYAPGEDKLHRLLVVAKQRKDGLAAAYEPALAHWRRLQAQAGPPRQAMVWLASGQARAALPAGAPLRSAGRANGRLRGRTGAKVRAPAPARAIHGLAKELSPPCPELGGLGGPDYRLKRLRGS